MTEIPLCPCCGGSGLADQPDDQPDPVAELRAWCVEREHWVGPDDTVRTDTAAALLGLEPQTLRADRAYLGRIPYRRVGSRILYRLQDLAAYLAAC